MTRILADLHTHSISSGHAYSTIKEILQAASERGLKYVGITDHAMEMPGAPVDTHFSNMIILNRKYKGTKLLCGTEANIIDYEGNIDKFRESTIERMDYMIASIHPPCIKPGTFDENTAAYIGAIKKQPKIRIIGHPDDARYPYDVEKVLQVAMEHEVLFELNNRSLSPTSFRKDSKPQIMAYLEILKREAYPLIINSDAHVDEEVGKLDYAIQFLEEINFPRELVINFDEEDDRLLHHLKLE